MEDSEQEGTERDTQDKSWDTRRYEPVEADVRRDPVPRGAAADHDITSPDQDVDADKLPDSRHATPDDKHDKTEKTHDTADKASEVKQDKSDKPEVKQDTADKTSEVKHDKSDKPEAKQDTADKTSEVKQDKSDKPEAKQDTAAKKPEVKQDKSEKSEAKQDTGDKKSDGKKDKDKKKSEGKEDKVSKISEVKPDNVEVIPDTKQDKSDVMSDIKQDSVEKCIDVPSSQVATHAPPPEKLFGVRYLQTFMMFLCLVISYSLRVNLSVAIVAMVDKEHANPDFEEFDWNDATTATILSSFFWGYVITQIPAGQLAQRFGPKMLLVGSATTCSIFTILTPVMASWGGWKAVCASRVVQGLAQGFVFPCIHTLLAKWAPVEERGRMSTYSYAGAQFGTILSLSLCGVIAESAAGWPTDFYLFGGVGICWAVVWFFVGSNSPAEHPFISKEERAYIEDSLSSCAVIQEERSTPWKYFFTSVPLWALIIVHSGQNWGFWTLLTEMPNYMKSVLNFDLKSNGFLSALPYLVMWLLSFVFSWASDFFNKKKYISLSASRKLFNTIAHWGPAVALIVLSYSNKDTPYVAVALLTIAVGLNAGTYLGFQVNHIDLSPNYAGTMMGITNCIANILSIIAPLAVGGILSDSTSVVQWRIVFFISAGIYFIGNLIFIIFGSAEVQPWNDPDKLAREMKDEEERPSATKFERCLSCLLNIC